MLLACLGSMLLFVTSKYQRCASLLTGLATMGLVSIDQHRLQPWAWQFVIVSLVLATAQPSTARTVWRWLVIGIYAWSAWSKIDYGFCVHHGPFLLDGICKAIGFAEGTRTWPANVRYVVAAAIPLFELLVAVGLCGRRTRRFAVCGAAAMHAGLLLSLGPWGHNHQPGVLVWNLFFLVQNWMLFWRHRTGSSVAEVPTTLAATRGNRFAKAVVIAALIWPLFEPLGGCDHWPSWAVYAAKLERVTVYLSESEFSQWPKDRQAYLGQQTVFDEWYPLRLDRWSLDALHAPIYPQDRFQVGVALALVRELGLNQIRIVIEGPANRFTGQRGVHEYVGRESVEKLADSYRLGARPRLE